ncbi:hypothetical protein [Leptolyngbya sp. FACHB-711]|uniref:hypothetical protein n=1 Tax=unclassified Leptolyngbya TaxID=2650499 RepID=UPI0016878E6C|nr:hypothetical protein [Leptolyngbya sp. FACHB-711]MBD1849229.1 hypothetical protein [Cyanobacteria bacterium FACHB-502]MBD2025193.1 hypothetical protein [Leptolyngbya sp. FACHB-711]
MSSSGRYNSRFLSFLSHQSIQIQDRSGILWRQAKLMAVWGVQITLYPIYLAFQSSRLATKQLRHSIGQTLPRLQAAVQRLPQRGNDSASTQAPIERQPLTSDTPIRKVLAAVQAMGISLPIDQIQLQPALKGSSQSVQFAPRAKPGKSPSLRVRGIACLIESQKLVLVTVQNQLLDGLTEPQQQQLRRLIVLELAEYWRQQRSLALSQSPFVDPFLPLPHSPHAILPIRLFYQLMAWEQRGTIALSTNLFQEARLSRRLTASQAEKPQLRSAEVNWLPFEEWSKAFSAAMRQKPQPTDRKFRWLQLGTQAFFDRLNRLDHPPDWEVTDTSAIERYNKGVLATWNRAPKAVQLYRTMPKSIAVNVPVSREVVPFTPLETALATVAPEPDQIAVHPAATSQAIEVASYIEAEVQLVGYIKHPLEQLLEWLDRGMVWIEDRIAKIWDWIRRWR